MVGSPTSGCLDEEHSGSVTKLNEHLATKEVKLSYAVIEQITKKLPLMLFFIII